jgi:hypothetical protein
MSIQLGAALTAPCQRHRSVRCRYCQPQAKDPQTFTQRKPFQRVQLLPQPQGLVAAIPTLTPGAAGQPQPPAPQPPPQPQPGRPTATPATARRPAQPGRTPPRQPGRTTAARRKPRVAMAPRPATLWLLTPAPPLTPSLAAATGSGVTANSNAMIPRPERIANFLLRIFVIPSHFGWLFHLHQGAGISGYLCSRGQKRNWHQRDQTGKVAMLRRGLPDLVRNLPFEFLFSRGSDDRIFRPGHYARVLHPAGATAVPSSRGVVARS